MVSLLSTEAATAEWLGDARYRVTLHDPHQRVVMLGGRPLEALPNESLDDWVGEFASTFGAEEGTNATVYFDDATDKKHALVVRLSKPSLEEDGSLRFDAELTALEQNAVGIHPQASLSNVWIVLDDEEGLLQSSPRTGVIFLAGDSSTLRAEANGDFTHSLTLADPSRTIGISQAPEHSVSTQTVAEFTSTWGRRFGNSAPQAMLLHFDQHSITDPIPSMVRMGRATLTEDGDVNVPLRASASDGDAAFLGDFALTSAPGRAVLLVDSAIIDIALTCHTSSDCEGTAVCDPIERACLFSPCSSADTCAPTEACRAPVGGADKFCYPDETCNVVLDCSAPATCEGATKDAPGLCHPKACSTSADCGSTTEFCRQDICQTKPVPPGQLETQHGVLWGGTWTTPQLNSTCFLTNQPRLAEFCVTFENAVQDRVLNLLGMLALSGDDFSYYGRGFFTPIDERSPIRITKAETFSPPTDALQNALFAPFAVLDRAFTNYSSRVGDALYGEPHLVPFADAQQGLASDSVSFLKSFWDAFNVEVTANAPDITTTPLALKHQYGGGGGFGCYFGAIAKGASDGEFTAGAPLLQFGAGFGYGVSESTGVDMGMGAGITVCSGAQCPQTTGFFTGGGGGWNWLFDGPLTGATTDTDTEPMVGFVQQLVDRKDEFDATHEYYYLSCGGGGGLGYQSRPDVLADSKFFSSIYSLGGGGNSWTIFRRMPKDFDPADHDVLAEAQSGDATVFAQDIFAILAGGAAASNASHTQATLESLAEANANRGLLTDVGVQKQDVNAILGDTTVGFFYQPYHEALPSGLKKDSTTTEHVYIPGSNARAELLYTQRKASGFDTSEEKALKDSLVQKVIYELNPAPYYFEYGAKNASVAVHDINEDTVAMLDTLGIDVLLTIPLYVAHGAVVETGVASIVSANKWILDESVRLAKAHTNVKGIYLGSGKLDAKKGFPSSCNANNFNSTNQWGFNACAGYEANITFEDYYYLLEHIYGLIGGTIQSPKTVDGVRTTVDLSFSTAIDVGINQTLELPSIASGVTTKAGWLTKTGISTPPKDPMSLLEYWLLTDGATRDGLKKFLWQLTKPPNVTKRMVLDADLVEWAGANDELDDFDTSLATLKTRLSDAISTEGLVPSDAIVLSGWYGTTDLATDLSGTGGLLPTLKGFGGFEIYLNQLFDQPWKALPANLPGMPDSLCGHTYPMPPSTQDDLEGPPLPASLPSECAPDFSAVFPPGVQPHPPCMCLSNITEYPAFFSPFVSDVTTLAASTGTQLEVLEVPKNTVRSWVRSTNPALGQSPSFYDVAVNGKDGAFNLAIQWKQWPEFLIDNCALWSGDSCAPAGAEIGGLIAPVDNGVKQPALRCTGVSNAQNGAANANAGTECPQVWFQFYCDGHDQPGSSGFPICPVVMEKDYSIPFDNEKGTYTNTALNAWDLQCPAVAPANKSVTRIEDDGSCIRVQWTARGSGYDKTTGWILKTLMPPQPPPGSVLREKTPIVPPTKPVARNFLTFAQTPMIVIPDERQILNPTNKEVTGTYEFCPEKDPGGDPRYLPQPQFFPHGTDHGQYWFRIQPVAGIPSVDAIDVEFDPICHQEKGTGKTPWNTIGKFTFDFPMPPLADGAVLQPPYSKVASVEFTVPPVNGVSEVDSFTVTAPVDNGIADFSLPGMSQCQGPNCPDCNVTPLPKGCPDPADFTTTMTVRFTEDIVTDEGAAFGPGKPCVVSFQITAGTDPGDQGGQAKKVGAAVRKDHPEDACFLEMGNAGVYVNGANFEWCGDQNSSVGVKLCTPAKE